MNDEVGEEIRRRSSFIIFLEPSPHRHGPVIVAMIAVLVVQVAIDEKIDVVAVRDGFMAAIGVIALAGDGRAQVRIGFAHGQDVVVNVVGVNMVKMARVEKIDVAFVLDADVSAIGVVNVSVIGMNGAFHNFQFLSLKKPFGFGRTRELPVTDMLKPLLEERSDVVVGQDVKRVSAVLSDIDDAQRPQIPKLVRHGGLGHAEHEADFSDAQFPFGNQADDSDAGRVRKGLEQLRHANGRRSVEQSVGRISNERRIGVIVQAGGRVFGHVVNS